MLLKPDAVARGPRRADHRSLRGRSAEDRWHEDATDGRRVRASIVSIWRNVLAQRSTTGTAGFIQTGPVIALAIEGVDAVAKVRKIGPGSRCG